MDQKDINKIKALDKKTNKRYNEAIVNKENVAISYFYDNGNLIEEINLKNGEPHGKTITYNEDKTIKRIKYFYNGIKKWKEFLFKDGILIGNYHNGNTKERLCRNYYDNGAVMSICTKIDGVLNGEAIIFRKNGKIKSFDNFKNGLRDGYQYEYYDNQKPKVISSFKNDLLHGKTKTYYKTGELRGEVYYLFNKEDGLSTYYDSNGTILTQDFVYEDKIIDRMSENVGKIMCHIS